MASESFITKAEISHCTSLELLCLSLSMCLLVRLRMPVSLVRSLPSNSATLTIVALKFAGEVRLYNSL